MLQILKSLSAQWGSYDARERQVFETALLAFLKVSLRKFPGATDVDHTKRRLQQSAKRSRLKLVAFRKNISEIFNAGICTVFCYTCLVSYNERGTYAKVIREWGAEEDIGTYGRRGNRGVEKIT